jgi:hypothetical protein
MPGDQIPHSVLPPAEIGTAQQEIPVNLNNLFFVVRTHDMKVTCVTDKFFGGDPNYICEAATPQQISSACKSDSKLRIVRSN